MAAKTCRGSRFPSVLHDASSSGGARLPRVSHLTRLPRVALPTLSPLARASTAVDISPSTRRRVTSVAHACRSALE